MSEPNDVPPGQGGVTTFVYDSAGPVHRFEGVTGRSYPKGQGPPAARPPIRFEHDPTARIFRLITADGTVEFFRDNPTRYLCVEPDAESGQMRPVLKHGRPLYLWLCREEREVR